MDYGRPLRAVKGSLTTPLREVARKLEGSGERARLDRKGNRCVVGGECIGQLSNKLDSR